MIDVRSILQEHASKEAPILVLAVRLECASFPKTSAEAACLALLP